MYYIAKYLSATITIVPIPFISAFYSSRMQEQIRNLTIVRALGLQKSLKISLCMAFGLVLQTCAPSHIS